VFTGVVRLLGPASARENRAAGCPEVVPAAEQTPPLTFEALSTAELCLAWRRSYLALLDVTSYPARCEIVRMRECLLDELERRDRDGFPAGSTPAPAPAATRAAT
jgi:hypothetical protein